MRTVVLFALLATTAAPALAAADEDGDRRSARIEARTERAERAERAVQADRAPRAEPRSAPSVNVERPRGDAGRSHDVSDRRLVVRPAGTATPVGRRGSHGGWSGENRGVAPVAVGTRGRTAPDSVRDWRRGDRTGTTRPGTIDERTALPSNRGSVGNDRTDHRRWRGDWRHDHRYDWRNHRHHHRSLFRLGVYFDPFGWGYNRFSIGSRLYPNYYQSSYWLNDPWQYRLPQAYGRYRWVRYYDDALLIDIYSGEVVDVIHQFFW